MFWKTLHLLVNLTFLLLAAVIMLTLLKDDGYREDLAVYKISVAELKQEVMTVNQNNFAYLEQKVNRLATGQDNYQISVDRRLDVLESRLRQLEQNNKTNSRIINTNTATSNYTNFNEQE